ncbi:MAG: DegV family protein [Lachnospiraceae bacterium]|nr:DegV family protein [Lachnospiraceae bacterium]
MKCKYVADSCCEFPEEFQSSHLCQNVPLTITVGDETIIDDETFNQADFLKKVASYPKCPHSACPSPEQYMQAYEEGDADIIFVTTLSSELSGSYNSAVLGMNLFLEEHPEKKVHVFNSRSASCGEAQTLLKAASLIEAGKSFEETVEETERFVYDDLQTYFVLESLEALRKNGRLSRMKALAINVLNIKPICFGNKGIIEQCGIARGMKKALEKMVELSLRSVEDTKKRILCISHCNCRKRAEEVLKSYLAKAEFLCTYILDTAGISSLYASDGGIIVTI